MTTYADVKQLVRPLLARHPDVTLVRRAIVLKPVHHLLRGVVLGGSSMKELIRPHWAIMHLHNPRISFTLNWGHQMYRSRSESWTIEDPSMGAELLAAIEQDVLPMLRRISTIDEFIVYTTDKKLSQRNIRQNPMDHAILEAARGDFDAACAICDDIARPLWREWFSYLAPDDFQRAVYELRLILVKQDRTGVARLLRQWEAQTVRNLKLEKIWEFAPLPIEIEENGAKQNAP